MLRKILLNSCSRLKNVVLDETKNYSLTSETVSRNLACCSANPGKVWVRWLRSSCCFLKSEDRKTMLASVGPMDEGVEGERAFDLDASVRSHSMFPDGDTCSRLFGGIRFDELPICHIKVTPNNTIMMLTDHKGANLCHRSCGMEGFKNAKKGTNIAAQATAITISMKMIQLGFKNIRVKIRGLGPGRMASIKGIEMSGINIISITDNTPIPYFGPRPKKQRRL